MIYRNAIFNRIDILERGIKKLKHRIEIHQAAINDHKRLKRMERELAWRLEKLKV